MEGAAVSNKLSKQHAEAARYKSELEKRGIVYLSRIPPFMKPNKVKSIFEEYGEVTRLFLQEEGQKAFFFICFRCCFTIAVYFKIQVLE